MKKPDRIQIYITAGKLGKHAGVYHSDRCWAAHPTDVETAAFRAAIKFWFGKGHNAAWLYRHVKRVAVNHESGSTWNAQLQPVEQLTIPAVEKAVRETKPKPAPTKRAKKKAKA